MSNIVLQPNSSGTGSITIATPNTNTDRTLNIPDVAGNLVTTGDTGTITGTMIASGTVTDAKIDTMTASKLLGTIAGARLPAGSVLQVVMGTTNTASSTGSSTYTDTGLSATITPSATTSKVLAMVNQPLTVSSATSAARDAGFRLVRGSTDLIQGMAEIDTDNSNLLKVPAYNAQMYLDSPNTTSATTYKTTFRVNAGTSDVYAQQHGATSSIILMEIAG